MAAEGRTLFLIASQRLPVRQNADGSQEPVPGLVAADWQDRRLTVTVTVNL